MTRCMIHISQIRIMILIKRKIYLSTNKFKQLLALRGLFADLLTSNNGCNQGWITVCGEKKNHENKVAIQPCRLMIPEIGHKEHM